MRGLAGTTILQRRLGTILEDLGIPVIEEYSTGRYRLDFFAPDEWLGFEADGPCHGRQINKDRLRDKEIMDRMGIPILRLTPMDIGNPVIAKLRITEFMREHRLEPRREPASF
jgi:very-short-patch-repair endonuclease